MAAPYGQGHRRMPSAESGGGTPPSSGGGGGGFAPPAYSWQQPGLSGPPTSSTGSNQSAGGGGGYYSAAPPVAPGGLRTDQHLGAPQLGGGPGGPGRLRPSSPASHRSSSPALSLPLGSGPAKAGKEKGLSWAAPTINSYAYEEPEGELDEVFLRQAFAKMDTNGNGSVSKLELIAAVTRETQIAELLGMDGDSLLSDESSFDQLHSIFEAMSGGKKSFDFKAFSKFALQACEAKTPRSNKMMDIFNLIDADGNGYVSKLELVASMQSNAAVDEFMTPGVDSSTVMDDEAMFEKVDALFEAIAGGKKRMQFSDFERYYRKTVTAAQPRPPSDVNRQNTRIFIIGPGFGNQINPRQSQMIENSGYQVKWCFTIPNPEQPNFPVEPYLDQIKAEMDAFRPHVVAAASKGGVYVIGLWHRRYWRGPTLMLNAHPMCTKLPQDMQVVIASGSNDEVYPNTRANLEELMATGPPNKCFLYYTANSGHLQSGQLSRVGDYHNMESLINHDVLPRLIDATLCPQGPEVHFLRTWRERLVEERIQAELWLGYSPEQVTRLWSTSGEEQGNHLFDVQPGTMEYRHVCAAFKALPKETQAYILSPPEVWAAVRPLRVQRVENALQGEGSWRPYYKSLCRSLEDQGVEFEPGTHTAWAFHGCDSNALESIINNPVAGFQPLASGTRSATLWGSGTYFARDAKYVADGGFCGQPAKDGTRRCMMCLLITGMPCLGDPNQKGVLPFRNKPHRYNCSVDCLASPEVFIVQHTGAAVPAYVITFA